MSGLPGKQYTYAIHLGDTVQVSEKFLSDARFTSEIEKCVITCVLPGR